MRVGVPREQAAGERRVALVPETVGRLVKAGHEVVFERAAGVAAGLRDADYESAGARLVQAAEAFAADAVLKVDAPTADEIALYREGALSISFFQAWNEPERLEVLNQRRITAFSMEQVPRTTRAQAMDALSSQATIAGYKAVLLAAERLPRILPMLVTAAGTLAPARALVLGAGVAGLMAIGTARRLGAVVEGFDVRAAAAEQVESLGAKFIGKELLTQAAEAAGGYAKELGAESEARNRELIRKHAREAHLVISTAAIPRKRAPLLLPEETVKDMQPGAVIVDLAAETGGNCALTQAGEEVVAHGVTILGPRRLPATVPLHASQMYSRNVSALLLHVVKDGALNIDVQDEIVGAVCVAHDGRSRS